MERKLLIKGMVCERCVRVLTEAFTKEGLPVKQIYLGEAVIESSSDDDLRTAENILNLHGFDVLHDKNDLFLRAIHAKIKEALALESSTGEHVRIKAFLSKHINKDYNLISSTFSAFENITIEQYMIRERINSAKELLVYSDKSISHIAYELGYKNISHLTKQFTAVTGLAPSHYRIIQGNKTTLASHA